MSKRRIYPPVYFLGAMIVMTELHHFAPVTRVLGSPWRYLGAVPVAAGVALAAVAARLFDRRGTTIKPFEESAALVVDGPFAYSRNPMYSGMVFVLFGVGMLLGTLTPFAIVPVFVWLVEARFIAVEEAALSSRFGGRYAEYKKVVRRWF